MAIGATGIWKFLSFINSLLVAAYFGVTLETDICFYLLFLGGIFVSLLLGLHTTVLIPEAIFLEEQPSTDRQGRQILNCFFFIYAVIVLVSLLAAWIIPTRLIAVFSRFSAEQLSQHVLLIRLSFLLFGLQLFATYFISVLEMYHRFSSALLSPLNAIIPLVFLLTLGNHIGIISMIYGFICSHSIQLILLLLTLKKELQWDFSFSWEVITPRLKHNLLSVGTQSVINLFSSWLPLYLLSGMGVGLVTALNYARQLAETPTEILTQRIVNLSKIQLTEYISHQDWQQTNKNYLGINHFLLFLLTPLAVFSCFYAPEIVIMFFKRGAFTLQDGLLAAGFLRPLLFVMLFIAPGTLQTNILSAARIWKEFLPYSFIGYFSFILAVPITMHLWGGLAYPYTLFVTNVIGTWTTYVCVRKYAPKLDGPSFLRQIAKILSLNIIALVPAAVYGWYFAGNNPWVTVFVAGVIFVTTLGGLSYYSGDLQFFLRQCLPNSKI